MSGDRIRSLGGRVAAGGALILVGVLFLDWHRVTVEVGGVVAVDEAASGWQGWGILVGLLAFALVAAQLVRRPDLTVASAALGCGILVATALAVFTGDVSVGAGPVGVEIGQPTGAAWAALVIGAVVAAAAVAPLVVAGRRDARVEPIGA